MTQDCVDPIVWLQHAWRNRIQSLVLLVVMAGFLALLGCLLWGPFRAPVVRAPRWHISGLWH